jgi:hypothetical protein
MADPVTLSLIAAGGAAAGGILGAAGAASSGAASSSMYMYKAGVAQINQQVETQNASWAVQSGGVASEEEGLKDAQQIGATKVAQAAGDLDVNSGSPAATRTAQVDAGQFNQQTIQWNAQKQAYGYAVKGAEAGAEAQMDTQAASQSRTAGTLGAITSVIGGVTSVASKWLQGSKTGQFGASGSNASTAGAGGGGAFDITGSLY